MRGIAFSFNVFTILEKYSQKIVAFDLQSAVAEVFGALAPFVGNRFFMTFQNFDGLSLFSSIRLT